MKNNGLFSTLFLDDLKQEVELDDLAKGRMATLSQAWKTRKGDSSAALWESVLKQALGYLNFAPANQPAAQGVYPLYEDYGFKQCLTVLYLIEPGGNLDDTSVGRFWPAKLVAELKKRKLNWGILTDGATWRLYSLKSSRPFEDYVELPLADALAAADEGEYGLFEHFFHIDSFVPKDEDAEASEKRKEEIKAGVYTCRLDEDRDASENVLEDRVKSPLLAQVDEVLQYLCNGFILDTKKTGEEYTEEERREIFESAVKLLYRCLFLFYAEARRLLPSEEGKAEAYRAELSIHALCEEARKFKWGERDDHQDYDLWQHLKGLVAAVNDGDPEYGIMGYNGGLFDDSEERFLGAHRLRNDFLSRALYLLAYVEPFNKDADDEYEIPYEDLEVRHLGELYENILEFSVSLCDADRLRRRTKRGVQILLASENKRQELDTLIKKGDVYFGESALERKQTGSYYTPESLVRFLNEKAIIAPLRERFDKDCRARFDQFLDSINKGVQQSDIKGAARSAVAQVQRFVDEVVLDFKVCDPAMGSGHFLVDAANQMAGLVVELLAEIPDVPGTNVDTESAPNDWRRQVTRHCLYGVDLNPLAVNLAKLSLWLNCFAMDHKLTFLDHHLRCGNSLIGLRTLDQLKHIPERKRDGVKKPDDTWFDLDDVSASLAKAGHRLSDITAIDEDDTDRQKSEFEEAHGTAETRLAPLADLFAAYLMDSELDRATYERLFSHFTGNGSLHSMPDENLRAARSSIETYRQKHQFFHWALEFPDVLSTDESGFRAIVGNPPWDAVKPKLDEFFLPYAPGIRKEERQKKDILVNDVLQRNPSVKARWTAYGRRIEEQAAYFKESAAFQYVGGGDINTYKLFAEQSYWLAAQAASIGVVLPSAFCTDEGSGPLRRLVLDRCRLDFLYCFENQKPAIFTAVHPNTKVAVIKFSKGAIGESFSCAFMRHDPATLPAVHAMPLHMSPSDVKRFSPDSQSIMEVESQRDLDVIGAVYGDNPLLSDPKSGWRVDLTSEFHMTNDRGLFLAQSNAKDMGLSALPSGIWVDAPAPKGHAVSHELAKYIDTGIRDGVRIHVPLIEGKHVFVFDAEYSPSSYMVSVQDALQAKREKRLVSLLHPKLVYRSTGQSGNERNLIVSILPPGRFTGNSLNYVAWQEEQFEDEDMVLLLALLSSFVVDFVLRIKIDKNINHPFVYSLPILKRQINPAFLQGLVGRAMRLTATNSTYNMLWAELFSTDWRAPDFWYPPAGNMAYGPAHERTIRERLGESAKALTKEWSTTCGVHDRLPDRRDSGDRAQIRAELDAYVAHLYHLRRDDFSYILDTFSVLRKKEVKAFGEYVSKRKCLEEYDRLAPILKGAK